MQLVHLVIKLRFARVQKTQNGFPWQVAADLHFKNSAINEKLFGKLKQNQQCSSCPSTCLHIFGKVVMFDDRFKKKILKFNKSKQHTNENNMVRSNVSLGARLMDLTQR